MSKKVYIVIPAYNEEKTIGSVVKDVAPYCDKIIVVDDGSTDMTASRAKGEKVKVLRHICNMGQGAALQTGFDFALKEGADIVITYDADGQFDSSDIAKILKVIKDKKVDVVLGSRFLGQAINIPKGRLIMLKAGILFTSIFSGVKLTDTHNGLRGLTKKALKKITLTQNQMAHASELIDLIAKGRLRYAEVPVSVRYNSSTLKKGQKNLNSAKVVFDLLFKKLS